MGKSVTDPIYQKVCGLNEQYLSVKNSFKEKNASLDKRKENNLASLNRKKNQLEHEIAENRRNLKYVWERYTKFADLCVASVKVKYIDEIKDYVYDSYDKLMKMLDEAERINNEAKELDKTLKDKEQEFSALRKLVEQQKDIVDSSVDIEHKLNINIKKFEHNYYEAYRKFKEAQKWYAKIMDIPAAPSTNEPAPEFKIKIKFLYRIGTTGFVFKILASLYKITHTDKYIKKLKECYDAIVSLQKSATQHAIQTEADIKKYNSLRDKASALKAKIEDLNHKVTIYDNQVDTYLNEINRLEPIVNEKYFGEIDYQKEAATESFRKSNDELKKIIANIDVPSCNMLKSDLTKEGTIPDPYLQTEEWKKLIEHLADAQHKALTANEAKLMEQIASIENEIEKYVSKVDNERKAIKEETAKQLSEMDIKLSEFKTEFYGFRKLLYSYILKKDQLNDENVKEAVSAIWKTASKRFLPQTPLAFRHTTVRDEILWMPSMIWPYDCPCFNLRINYNKKEAKDGVRIMNSILLNMLTSVPSNKLRFSFVDLNMTNFASELTTRLDPKIYHGAPIVREQDFRKKIEDLQERMAILAGQCSNVLDYNRKNERILMPYEVVVLVDFPEVISPSTLNMLKPLLINGYKGGIFFVCLTENETPCLENFFVVPGFGVTMQDDYCLCPQYAITNLRHALYARINKEASNEENVAVLEKPFTTLKNKAYISAADSFCLEIGENNGRRINFRFNETDHIHSFVLGQSGSGKSVFLHNIILDSILRYSPDSLRLYLMDFKLGGVEFARYKDVKHVKALLVDNSDQQITLEILRDLYAEMKKRGEMLRNSGVSTLHDFNTANPTNPMPRIVLMVDECHELFRDKMDRMQQEINSIMSRIAKEGRSQGVHLILATQTLANSNIPPEILNNISDYYLLKCAQNDAEKLIRDSSRITSTLSTGRILYAYNSNKEIFQAYFSDKAQIESCITSSIAKSSSYDCGERFFFSGKQNYMLDNALMSELTYKIGREPLSFLGKSIDLNQRNISSTMRGDSGENMLFFGTNSEFQTVRTALVAFKTLINSYYALKRKCDFYVINFLNASDCELYSAMFDSAFGSIPNSEKEMNISFIESKKSGEFLLSLSESIRNGSAKESIVLMLGQEKFRELRLDMPLKKKDSVQEQPHSELTGHLQTSHLASGGLTSRFKEEKKTYKSELKYILENGPEQNVHFIIQLDKPANLLYENVITQQFVFSLFKHVVMLKSVGDAALKLRLPDDIRLDTLSDDVNRLRAYYYNDDEADYTLFTPYTLA